MNPILRNIIAVIVGWFGGSSLNMALIQAGHAVFPMEGIDTQDMNALAEVMPTLSVEYFIFPFAAHAGGTLVGAIIAGLIAASHKMIFSLSVGGLFLLGGIAVSFMLPAPTYFVITDLLLAYIPMGFVGGKIALLISGNRGASNSENLPLDSE